MSDAMVFVHKSDPIFKLKKSFCRELSTDGALFDVTKKKKFYSQRTQKNTEKHERRRILWK